MATMRHLTSLSVLKFTNILDSGCDMHDCLRLLLRLCRWAGMFPIGGLHRDTITELRFNRNAMYLVYHMITLAGQTLLLCCSIYFFFSKDVDLSNATNLLFYANAFLAMAFLTKLAKRWPDLVKRASCIEVQVASVRQDRSLSNKCRWLTATIMILALVEHALSVVFRISLTASCSQVDVLNATFSEIYFTSTAGHVFSYISYSWWRAVLYQIMHLQATFLWSIIDVLTICISVYLVSYFNDLNKIIQDRNNKSIIRWGEIRVFYSHLIELVREVDHNLCLLILLSVFTNLAFICLQTFYLLNQVYPSIESCETEHVVKSYTSPEHFVYYAFSTVFLFSKATVMFLLASNVNYEASKPLFTLLYVPSSEYTIEVQRFSRQVRYTTNALSGYLFYITRPMLIQTRLNEHIDHLELNYLHNTHPQHQRSDVGSDAPQNNIFAAATIIKYELVLLQELSL